MRFIIFAFLSIGSFSNAYGEDVYNFYFNKSNKNQNEMIKKASKPEEEKKKAKIVEQKTPLEAIKDRFKTWEGAIGYSMAHETGDSRKYNDDNSYDERYYVADGFKLTASKFFNPYIGLDLGFGYYEFKNFKSDDYFLQGNLGLVLTPFRLNLFGHDLFDFSLVGGMTNLVDYEVRYDEDGRNGKVENKAADALRTYYGVRIGLNFTSDFALVSETFYVSANQVTIGVSSASLRYKF